MNRFFSRLSTALVVASTVGGFQVSPVSAQTRSSDLLPGFSAATAEAQAICEARFMELPSGDDFREHLRLITSTPHPTGSAAQIEVAHYLGRVMKAAGLTVREHPYDVYLPQLTDDVEAHIVTPVAMRLSNREPALADDRFSGHPDLLNV
jgi:N-acetylated-alpha-linked acidic dipeptidase